ncbi:glucosylceramidase [soil metagenome]
MNKTLSILFILCMLAACSKSGSGSGNGPVIPPPVTVPGISFWTTTADHSSLLLKQTTAAGFAATSSVLPMLTVDSTQTFQTIDGFGYTLTQGSADVISQLVSSQRTALLTELFGSAETGISVNYLRVGIGATDLSSTVYSYDDMPAGQTDPTLANFSLAPDQASMIPILKQILLINPNIKILACPWSAPVWMKDNGNSVGGSLLPAYYQAYANYFVKYIQGMQAEGIPINAITPQNEPLNPSNNPSLYMTAAQQAVFIKNNLGPAFAAAGITTKIIIYDHNCDRPDYPLEVLSDPAARAYIDGAAFHLYAGNIAAMSQIAAAYPGKNVYFTEQYTSSTGNFGGDLQWHMKNVIVGSMRNNSRIALEWNLANDASYGPHTTGGCNSCLGAITISSGGYSHNVAFYIIAHASKFIPAGSKRIASDNFGTLNTAAFLRPDGKKVLIVMNDSNTAQNFNIKFNGKWLSTYLAAGSVSTYVW